MQPGQLITQSSPKACSLILFPDQEAQVSEEDPDELVSRLDQVISGQIRPWHCLWSELTANSSIKNKQTSPTEFWLKKLSCSTSCSFQKEFERLVTILKLILNILCEHDPVQWVRHERAAHVEGSTVSEQGPHNAHVHEICCSCNKWQRNVHGETDVGHKEEVHVASM